MSVMIGVAFQGSGELQEFKQGRYLSALRHSGAQACVLPWVETAQQAREALAGCAGLVLPGGQDVNPSYYGQTKHPLCGADHPQRDTSEMLYLAEARAAGLPVLGICRGFQLINVALGGTLWQDLSECPNPCHNHRDYEGRAQHLHTVTVKPGSWLAPLCEPVQGVNSIHHQAVRDLAPGMECTAVSDDGLVEAIESTEGSFVVGVQWHPEHLFDVDPCAQRIFGAFVREVEQEAARR